MASWYEKRRVISRIRRFFSGRAASAYIVGGYLRDRLLGRDTHDLDIVVLSGAIPLARALANELGGYFYVLDQERDVGRIILKERHLVDLSHMRGQDIYEDLAWRDFTINAMAQDLLHPRATVIDPMEGQKDLAARSIRSNSEGAFREDPLRLLRAVRLAGELGFGIDRQTEQLMQRDASLITLPAAERVLEELSKILILEDASAHLRYLGRLGILSFVLSGLGQEANHHALATVEALEALLSSSALPPQTAPYLRGNLADERSRLVLLKLCALLHHLSQPTPEHPPGPLDITALDSLLRGIRLSGVEMRHMRSALLGLAAAWQIRDASPLSAHRFFRELRDAGVDALLLYLTDSLTILEKVPTFERREDMVLGLLRLYFEEQETILPPPYLSGNEMVAALDLEPGPLVGQLQCALAEAQVEGKVRNREEALKLLRELVAQNNHLISSQSHI